MALDRPRLPAAVVPRDGRVTSGIEGGLIRRDFDLDDKTFFATSMTASTRPQQGDERRYLRGHDSACSRRSRAPLQLRVVDEIGFNTALANSQAGGFFDAEGRGSAISAMVNALLDFGDDDSWSGYVGGGLGYARVKYRAVVDDPAFGAPGPGTPAPLTSFGFSDTDDAWAWQVIAGIRAAISPMSTSPQYRASSTPSFNALQDGTDASLRLQVARTRCWRA